ncbi:MAG: type II toxin-antitoxin system Phd/YefM family antitoxin [Anaerolineales bacterium]|nr:type II toxin-antitoxin system Phd/YefM family antitoxin [Chloroflexota bacterium]MBL6983311.1 type II toxin-antitoxin system Phd/YefM family antitoxin [Anaerolineales bacterium]
MVTVGVRELKQQASELIRQVRENGQEIQVTYRGEVVALVVPVKSPPQSDITEAWDRLDVLAAEIGARWPEGVTSVEAVTEGRS